MSRLKANTHICARVYIDFIVFYLSMTLEILRKISTTLPDACLSI